MPPVNAIPWTELRDPNTGASRLRELARHPSEIVRRWVARHPNTPGETLLALLDDRDSWVPWNLAQNKAASAELLEELVARRLCLDKVAANRNTPGQLLSQLAREPGEAVRAAVANNPATSEGALDGLADDSSLRVRWCVARNTAAPPNLLERLASDSEDKVRRAVARNRNTPKPLKIALKHTLGMG